MFLKRKTRMRDMRWLAILAYPIAFIKGILVGRMLGMFRRGR